MEQVSGLNIRNMPDADMAANTEHDQKLATREAAWQQKASSHLGTYSSSLSCGA